MTDATTTGLPALREMRTDRRRRRVAEIEWFDALYRVYLAALIGGFVAIFLSEQVKDAPFTASQIDAVMHDGPRVAGLIVAVTIFLGLRSGANGGPLSIEDAEVRHVLLAPVDRGAVLRRPAAQRIRTLAFVGAIAGGAAGLLVGKRMPADWETSRAGFVIVAAVAGAITGAAFVIAALLAHGLRVHRAVLTLVGGGLVCWQAESVFAPSHPAGPFTAVGLLGLDRLGAAAASALALSLALAAVALLVAGRLRIEALARRSALVSQLKFAVTMQDIRTVVLLRRQLGQEHMRARAWFPLPRVLRRDPVTARCMRSLARFPLRRILRMAFLAAVAAAGMVAVWRGTTPGFVVSGLAAFLLGLDVIEPLSQEVDRPDRTDALPTERGLLLARHLLVPALATLPFVVIGGAVAFALEPHGMTVVSAVLIGIPAALAGVCGAVINAVRGAPDPLGDANAGLYMPPEMSGMGTVIRTAWPPFVSVLGSSPMAVLVRAHDNGENLPAVMLRTALGVGVLCFLVAGWVRQRDAIRQWFRNAQKMPSSGGNT